jgi:cell division protein FtsI/penicillin-binding protein 2
LKRAGRRNVEGTPGKVVAECAGGRRLIPGTESARQEAKPGRDVFITIDSAIQHVTQNALADVYKQTQAAERRPRLFMTQKPAIFWLWLLPAYNINDPRAASGSGGDATNPAMQPRRRHAV